MNKNELATPIRLYWDIGPAAGLGLSEYQRIAGEVVANRFLSLQITETAPVISEACLTILETLQDQPVALSLVAFPEALDAHSLDVLKRFPLKVLFAAIGSRAALDAVRQCRELAAAKTPLGLSFAVTGESCEDLPEVLSYCIENRFGHLLLPMQRLVLGETCFSLTAGERDRLTERLRRVSRPASFKITIHDPFLWKAFYPSDEFPGGGCQAANTMLYVSPQGHVYPCPVLPIQIGDLKISSLKEIIRSEIKKDARRIIVAEAQQCKECSELRRCRGGCRGRAYAFLRSLNEPDPACR